MKYLNIALCLLMVFFAGVQYNDPDGLFWMAIYAVPALAAGLVGFYPQGVRKPAFVGLYGIATLAAIGATIYFWPETPGFWRQEVWWHTETAREGMGMMIVALVLLVASIAAWREAKKANSVHENG